MERPLGYDSRDQALFIDDDGTGYLLSATNMNSDINIYKLDETWTRPVALVNTICKGQHRETPSIIKILFLQLQSIRVVSQPGHVCLS